MQCHPFVLTIPVVLVRTLQKAKAPSCFLAVDFLSKVPAGVLKDHSRPSLVPARQQTSFSKRAIQAVSWERACLFSKPGAVSSSLHILAGAVTGWQIFCCVS